MKTAVYLRAFVLLFFVSIFKKCRDVESTTANNSKLNSKNNTMTIALPTIMNKYGVKNHHPKFGRYHHCRKPKAGENWAGETKGNCPQNCLYNRCTLRRGYCCFYI
jgi:hypothetical protein